MIAAVGGVEEEMEWRAATAGGDEDQAVGLVVGYGRSGPALVGALRAEGVRCVGVDSYQAAIREAARWRPDVILVGTNPDGPALRSFLGRLRETAAEAIVLYLSDCQSKGRAVAVIEWGADDVVCPPHSVSAIIIRHHVLRRFGTRHSGQKKVSRHIGIGSLRVDLATRQVLDGGRPFSLSGREFELLVCLMEAGGEVVRREELCQDIWGDDGGSEAALDATVHRLRRKLEAGGTEGDLITTVRGIGYRLEVEALKERPGAG